jgi:hypothetical protein
VSYELMRAVIEQSNAKDMAKAVAIAIASYPAPGTNIAFPSNQTLMCEWGFSERTVQRALRKLEALGELQRQVHLESGRRPRVYLIAPGFRRQLELDHGRQSECDARQTGAMTPVTSCAPAYEGVEGLREQPPRNPPADAGGWAHEQTSVVEPITVAALPERRRETQARRARRRRRMIGAAPLAPDPCPLAQTDGAELAALKALWDPLAQALRSHLGESMAEIWFIGAGAHLHPATGAALELGVPASTATWVSKRFGSHLERAAGRPVTCVPCLGAVSGEVTG